MWTSQPPLQTMTFRSKTALLQRTANCHPWFPHDLVAGLAAGAAGDAGERALGARVDRAAALRADGAAGDVAVALPGAEVVAQRGRPLLGGPADLDERCVGHQHDA